MTASPAPAPQVVRSRGWQAGVAAVVLVILFAFNGAVRQLAGLWYHKADYSHGLLLLPFAAYLLYTRRDLFPKAIRWPDLWGLPFLGAAVALYLLEERVNYAKEWAQAFALVLAVAGVAVLFCGGWGGLRWAWPALAIAPLTFELPWQVERDLSLTLRGFAAKVATAAFQTGGVPTYAEGNVVVVGDTRLDVAHACSGLSMLLVFVAVAAAVAVLARSPPVADRVIVLASAVPIAVLCNIGRIVLTGLVYHAGWKELGDKVAHDLFGWLMMAPALGMIWLELRLIDWVLVPAGEVPRDEMLKTIRAGADRVLLMPRASAGPVPQVGSRGPAR